MLWRPDEDHPHTDPSNAWASFDTGDDSAGYVDARPKLMSMMAVFNAEAPARLQDDKTGMKQRGSLPQW